MSSGIWTQTLWMSGRDKWLRKNSVHLTVEWSAGLTSQRNMRCGWTLGMHCSICIKWQHLVMPITRRKGLEGDYCPSYMPTINLRSPCHWTQSMIRSRLFTCGACAATKELFVEAYQMNMKRLHQKLCFNFCISTFLLIWDLRVLWLALNTLTSVTW